MVAAKAAGSHASTWFSSIRPALLLVAEAIRKYDIVIIRTQKLNLHPQWEEAINDFAAAHERLGVAFTGLFPRRRGDDYMTPKVACLIYDVPRWIKEYGWSLIVVSEQAFEAVHYAYMEVEKKYKIPCTGAELIVGKRRWSSDSSWSKKPDKQKRTASKNHAKGKKPGKKPAKQAQKAKKTRRATEKLQKKYERARELQRQAVAAFNAQNVASGGPLCVRRMQEILKFQENGDASETPPWRS